MRRTLITAIFVFSLLGGCLKTSQDVISTWEGSSEGELLLKWGAPDRTAESGGIRFLTYKNYNLRGGLIGSNTIKVDIASEKIVGGSCSGQCGYF